MDRPRHLLIILNRRAAQKRMDRFRAVLGLLDAVGCTYEVKETQAAGDAARFAAEAAAETVDAVAVAGGDGTINDAINGFHPATPPLGLIPLGTANVLAHEIGLATDPAAIAAALTAGRCLSVVPGQANGRRFMMMASVGFDAHVVGGVRRSVKRRIGKLVYVLSALRQLLRYPCPHLTALVDGRPVTAATLVVSRGRLYGGRYVMAPAADLATPEFQVSIFRRKGRLAMAGYSAALPLGLLNRWNLIDHVVARRVEVHARPGDPVQADGDTATALPVVIDLADQAIEVLVPPDSPVPSVGASRKTTCLERSYGA
ncbi:diacylglycerol/lipid kinase family protein [Caenispirillum bisanense]|nr:YegS/Rv2252/BmrU family lipid kinase [Caenispirillum bisanense]